MRELHLEVGAHSAQGLRANNEDSFIADGENAIFLVADGMGGQENGEMASMMAAKIIPQILKESLASQLEGAKAVKKALAEANLAIIEAGQQHSAHRRMGTTAVLALRQRDQVFVAGVGDSRAYLIREKNVEQLTIDHTVAKHLELMGTLTAQQAKESPWRNHLYRFLGCAQMLEGAEVKPFTSQPNDILLLGSDGLTNHVHPADLVEMASQFSHPQPMAEHLIQLALDRGSRDNVTCVLVKFCQ